NVRFQNSATPFIKQGTSAAVKDISSLRNDITMGLEADTQKTNASVATEHTVVEKQEQTTDSTPKEAEEEILDSNEKDAAIMIELDEQMKLIKDKNLSS